MSKMLEALKKDKNRGRNFVKAKRLVMSDTGKYKLRIFPNQDDPEGLPYEKVFLHFGFMHPNYNNPGTFRCLGRDCPLCREAKKMKESGDKNAWKFLSTPVFLYYVLDSQGALKYVRLSATAHNAVTDELIARQKSKVNPVDIATGRVAEISVENVTEKGKTKKVYKCIFGSEPSPIHEKSIEEFEAHQPLSEIYRVWTKADLEKVVKGEKIVFGRSDSSEYAPTSSYQSKQSAAPADDYSSSSEDVGGMEDSEPAPSRPAMISGADYDEDDKPSTSSAESLEAAKARVRASLGED